MPSPKKSSLPGIEAESPAPPALQADSLQLTYWGGPHLSAEVLNPSRGAGTLLLPRPHPD